MATPHSLYLHVPFCRHRCSYCDFNTYAGLEHLVGEYVRALCREIELLGEAAGERLPVHTLFFGGGTPSLLPPETLEQVLRAVQRSFALLPGLEITLEANPGSLSPEGLRACRSLGINRLSLGLQSAAPEELQLLERQHDYADAARAVAWSRRAGFENLNLDLIFGLPGQSLQSWKRSLQLAFDLRPDHFSLYGLTLERGTPMAHWVDRGLLPEPEADLAADMYEWAAEFLERGGYRQYEISNWARRNGSGEVMACRHNLQYWRNLPYLGLGAGAHGYAAGVRTANVLAPLAYVRRCLGEESPPSPGRFPATPATAELRPVDRASELAETMMMGLRLTDEGVSRPAFLERFGQELEEVFGREIGELIKQGLLEWGGPAGERLRLTRRGRLLGNRVFVRFL